MSSLQLVVERAGDRSYEWRHMESRLDWVGQGEPAFQMVQRCHRGRFEIHRTLFQDNSGALVSDLQLRPLVGTLDDYRLFLAWDEAATPLGEQALQRQGIGELEVIALSRPLLEKRQLQLDERGTARLVGAVGGSDQEALRRAMEPLDLAVRPYVETSGPPLERLYGASVALLKLDGEGTLAADALAVAGDLPRARELAVCPVSRLILAERLGEEACREHANELMTHGRGSALEIRALRYAARSLGSDLHGAAAERWVAALHPETDLLGGVIHGVLPPRPEWLAAYDQRHRVETRRGSSWRSDPHLPYGEASLTVQRARVEAIAGRRKEARRLLHLVASQAGGSLLIPERILASPDQNPLFNGVDLGGCPDLAAHAHFVLASKGL